MLLTRRSRRLFNHSSRDADKCPFSSDLGTAPSSHLLTVLAVVLTSTIFRYPIRFVKITFRAARAPFSRLIKRSTPSCMFLTLGANSRAPQATSWMAEMLQPLLCPTLSNYVSTDFSNHSKLHIHMKNVFIVATLREFWNPVEETQCGTAAVRDYKTLEYILQLPISTNDWYSPSYSQASPYSRELMFSVLCFQSLLL